MTKAAGSMSPKEQIRPRRTLLPGVMAVEATSARAYPRHFHDEFGIGLMLDGAQDSASGRGPVRAERGQLITVNPGEVHDGLPVGRSVRRWRMLYFDPGSLAGVFAGLGVSTRTELARPVLENPAAAASFLSLHAAITGALACALEIESLQTETLAYLVDLSRNAPVPKADAVAPARRRIDEDPETDMRVDDLAALCGLSRFHFLRAFKAAMGIPPHAYQVQRRLHLARRMIVAGASIADAAVAAGFADQSHLSRHLLRAHGYSPGALARA